MRDNPCSFDQFDICAGAAISDRRLICVHFDDRVVHPHGGKRRKYMLDRVHAHRAFANRCRPLDRFEIIDLGVNRRLLLQIFALEFDPVINWGRLQLQRDLFAGV